MDLFLLDHNVQVKTRCLCHGLNGFAKRNYSTNAAITWQNLLRI